MRKLIGIIALSLLVFVMAGCSDSPGVSGKKLLQEPYGEIEKSAEGATVRFYMYGGFAHVNTWVDSYVAREVKERYGINLVRVPMDASVFVNKLLTEKAAGKDVGTIDLLWVNGENFKALKEAEALFGPYAERLPNYVKYANKDLVAYDFGYPTDGYETPYGWAQFVFEYEPKVVANPPKSFAELREWVRANPGKFTYPQPPDFTGSAFVRQVFYAVTGGSEQYMDGYNPKLYAERSKALWEYLNDLKPYLWNEGKAYPKDSAAMDTLFSRGEIAINMSYHPLHAQSKVLEGVYPKSVRTFVMSEGSIFNLHFTAIPFNAPQKAAAMVVANFLMSPEAQLSKFEPENWGDYPAIDLTMVPENIRAQFTTVNLGEPTMPFSSLALVAVPEIPAEYVEALEKGWEKNVR